MAKDLSIRIVGDASSFNRSVDQATKKTDKLSSKFGSMAKGGAIGAAVGGVALLSKTLFDSVGAAQEAEKAEARFSDAMNKVGASAKQRATAQAQISELSKKTALDDEDLSDVYSKLVRTTGDVTKAQQAMALSADIARARNISLESASKTVEKAYNGNEGALKKLGIEIDKNASSSEIMATAQKKFSGAAEAYGKTSAGAQEKFGVALENLQEKIGQKILPIMAKLALAGVNLIDWAEKNWPKFKEAAEPVFNAVKVVIDNLIDKIKAIVAAVQGVVKIIQGIRDGEWGKVWEGIKQVVVDGALGMVKAMVALPAAILAALGKKAWEGLSAVGGFISGAILGGIGAIGDGISSLIVGGVNKAIDLLNKAIDAYNSIPILGDIGHVGHISAPASAGKIGGPPIAGRAAGGPVTAGMPYWVGEKGPELFTPGRSGSIMPNGRTAMAGGGVIQLHSHVHLDGREIFTTVQKFATRDMRSGGAGVPGIGSL